VWFFPIPKIWTVIFCCAVLLVPFFGEELSGGETFLSLFVTKQAGWLGLQSAGMVNLWKENETKSVLQYIQRQWRAVSEVDNILCLILKINLLTS
jgi:hypothetical protein